MVDAGEKKLKKVAVTEEDVCTLLQRYSASTVLALLREVAQFPEVKIDWQALVKKTKTGIRTAREYQMLWRHLAYRKPLIESVDPEDQPLDDDSDLECELEACPPVSNEAMMEASNCVKVLASGLANESSIPNSSSVEGGALHVNMSNISSENPQAAVIFGEGLDVNGSAINRKRRKPWSEEEDLELITAVQKFGEGSWAAIIKGEFKGNRNATQLAQRWNIIRKKQGTLNIGGAKIVSPQLTEAQLATRHALDMAFKDKLTTGSGTAGNESAGTTTPRISASKTDLPVSGAAVPLSQPQSTSVTCTTSSAKQAPVASMPKARPQKKAAQSSVSADSIQAAAVAAGARIASPSDAASLFKAVQSKNTVHIRGGGSLIKTSAAGSSSPLPPNVHFIRTGLAPTPAVSAGTATFVQPAKGSAIRPSVAPAAVSQLPKARTTSVVAMDRINAAQKKENRTVGGNVQCSDAKSTTGVHEDNASLSQCLPKASLDKCRATSLGADVTLGKQIADANAQCAMNRTIADNELKDDACKQVIENPVPMINNEKSVQSSISSVNGTHEITTTLVNGGAEKMEVSSEGMVGVKVSGQKTV